MLDDLECRITLAGDLSCGKAPLLIAWLMLVQPTPPRKQLKHFYFAQIASWGSGKN